MNLGKGLASRTAQLILVVLNKLLLHGLRLEVERFSANRRADCCRACYVLRRPSATAARNYVKFVLVRSNRATLAATRATRTWKDLALAARALAGTYSIHSRSAVRVSPEPHAHVCAADRRYLLTYLLLSVRCPCRRQSALGRQWPVGVSARSLARARAPRGDAPRPRRPGRGRPGRV